MATYEVNEFDVDINSKRFVNAASGGYGLDDVDKPRLYFNEKVVWAVNCYDRTLSQASFATSSTWELYADVDFDHDSYTGTLNAALTTWSATTAIVIDYATAPGASNIPSTGAILLRDDAGNRERVDYSAVSGAGTTQATYTVNSTLNYPYATGDYAANEDPLMVSSDNDDFNVSGDWASLDVANGKISVQVDCTRWKFSEKVQAYLASNSGANEVPIWVQINRYTAGQDTPSVILQDTIYAKPSVRDIEEAGSTTGPNWSQSDARYVQGVANISRANFFTLVDSAGTIKETDSMFISMAGSGNPVVYWTSPGIHFTDSDGANFDVHGSIFGQLTDTADGTEDFDVYLKQMINGTLTEWLTADADGEITFGAGRAVAVSGEINASGNEINISGATPQLVFKDTDCTDSDDNAAITVNASATSSGGENVDVTFKQQVNGTLTTFLTADADGDISFDSNRAVSVGSALINATAAVSTEKLTVSGDGYFDGDLEATGVGKVGSMLTNATAALSSEVSTIRRNSTDTTSVLPALVIHRDTTGTPTNGYGSSIEFWGKSANGTNYRWADIQAYGALVTADNREGFMKFRVSTAAGVMTDALFFGSTGSLGVGATPSSGATLQVNGGIYFGITNDQRILETGTNSLAVYTAGTEAIRVTNTNQLFVNATAAVGSEKLGVDGDAYVTGDYRCATGKGLVVNGTRVVTDQQTALTAAKTGITVTGTTSEDYDFSGAVTNSSPYGLATADEFETMLEVIQNLQTRVNELETKLQAHGLIA